MCEGGVSESGLAAVREGDEPGVRQVRGTMAEGHRVRSMWKGLAIATPCFGAYIGGWIVAVSWPGVAGLAAGGVLAFVGMCLLFLIGHDACHGSLTPSRVVNRIIGRLAFLTSFHPYTSWAYTHNSLHHGYTNVRGLDPVYAPMSPEMYREAPAWRRLLERVYRHGSGLGLGLYYFLSVYLRHEIMPDERHLPRRRRPAFIADLVLISAYAAGLVAIGIWATQTPTEAAWFVVAMMVLPLLGFHWVMGFVTFLHHTHPTVRWYADRDEWSFYKAQVRSVVHLRLPRPFELLLLNIMDHTAHHADPSIPLYELPQAQRELEAAYVGDVVDVPWSFTGFFHTMRCCKLFDYSKGVWTDFAGRVTANPQGDVA
jgi:omega-6 fatty acid desaturase (delta-12 desaturase)